MSHEEINARLLPEYEAYFQHLNKIFTPEIKRDIISSAFNARLSRI